MKQLQFGDEIYEAEKIYSIDKKITGKTDGITVFEFTGVKKPELFVLLNGSEFDEPEPDPVVLTTALMGGTEMANEQVAGQVHRALQLFAQTLNENTALQIADLYPAWQENVSYEPGTIIRHGKNEKGKSQLYSVMQKHTSKKADLPGPALAALYKKIGFTESGIAIWVQPQGAHDAYKKDAIVMHKDIKYKSSVPNNTWEPSVYGWTVEP